MGIASLPAKRSGVQPAGERPEAFNPTRRWPSQRMAKTSEPMPLEVGSTTVSVIAAASPASTALPPLASMASPACAASGCEVAMTFFASTGIRCEGYGKSQVNIGGSGLRYGANGSIRKKRLDNDPRDISACIRRVRHDLRRAFRHARRGIAVPRQGRRALRGVARQAAGIHVAAQPHGPLRGFQPRDGLRARVGDRVPRPRSRRGRAARARGRVPAARCLRSSPTGIPTCSTPWWTTTHCARSFAAAC